MMILANELAKGVDESVRLVDESKYGQLNWLKGLMSQ
jgi:hypothetical protein